MKKLAPALGGLLLAVSTTAAQAIPLSSLFSGSTLQVEDKRFSDWRLKERLDPFAAPPIDLDLIEVTGISGNPLNPGLNFAIGGGGLQAGGVPGLADDLLLHFEFKVTVLDRRMRIKDNELNFFNGWFASADTFLFIDETVCTSANCGPNPDALAYKEVWVNIEPGLPDIIVEQDIQNFLPQQAIWVDKFISVQSFDGGPAGITNFQQFFSQEVLSVPEPGTLAIIALGLIGAGFARRRLG